jgi:AraC-like DNA-binding protein
MAEHLTVPLLRRDRFYCYPESTGYYELLRNHEVNRPAGLMHDFNLHLITAGAGFVETDQQRYELKAGDAFLYFPGERQFYYSNPEQPWDIKWIHFYGKGVLADLTERGFHRSIVWRIRAPKMLESRMDDLLHEMEQHKTLHPTRLSMLMYGVVAELMEQAEPLSIPTTGASAIERIIALLPELQASATEPFDLNAWANRAGTNRFAFCKWFRHAAGQTPMEFVTACRIQRAKQLLVERAELPVHQVSQLSGYENPSYFNKRFLENEQMTPSAYRNLFLALKS